MTIAGMRVFIGAAKMGIVAAGIKIKDVKVTTVINKKTTAATFNTLILALLTFSAAYLFSLS